MAKEAKDQFIPLTEAAEGTPYSQEYLSLLARTHKLTARKWGRNWYTTKTAIREYIKKRSDKLFTTLEKNGGIFEHWENVPINTSGRKELTVMQFEKFAKKGLPDTEKRGFMPYIRRAYDQQKISKDVELNYFSHPQREKIEKNVIITIKKMQ